MRTIEETIYRSMFCGSCMLMGFRSGWYLLILLVESLFILAGYAFEFADCFLIRRRFPYFLTGVKGRFVTRMVIVAIFPSRVMKRFTTLWAALRVFTFSFMRLESSSVYLWASEGSLSGMNSKNFDRSPSNLHSHVCRCIYSTHILNDTYPESSI